MILVKHYSYDPVYSCYIDIVYKTCPYQVSQNRSSFQFVQRQHSLQKIGYKSNNKKNNKNYIYY